MKLAKHVLTIFTAVVAMIPLVVIFVVIWVSAMVSGVGSDEGRPEWDTLGAP